MAHRADGTPLKNKEVIMEYTSPIDIALLAKTVYDVHDDFLAKAFIKKHRVLSQKPGSSKRLKAEVGSRLINTKDGFGICARGGIGYENDTFIIFRGMVQILSLMFVSACRCQKLVYRYTWASTMLFAA